MAWETLSRHQRRGRRLLSREERASGTFRRPGTGSAAVADGPPATGRSRRLDDSAGRPTRPRPGRRPPARSPDREPAPLRINAGSLGTPRGRFHRSAEPTPNTARIISHPDGRSSGYGGTGRLPGGVPPGGVPPPGECPPAAEALQGGRKPPPPGGSAEKAPGRTPPGGGGGPPIANWGSVWTSGPGGGGANRSVSGGRSRIPARTRSAGPSKPGGGT